MVKWQPVMVVLSSEDGNSNRLECACGAIGIFVSGVLIKDGSYNCLDEVDVWCQECFSRMQRESESV